jgi:hypothetical protein
MKTNICKVRHDIVDEGFLIPVGDMYVEKGEYPYRWMDDNTFQIYLDGVWLFAYSCDFEFK